MAFKDVEGSMTALPVLKNLENEAFGFQSGTSEPPPFVDIAGGIVDVYEDVGGMEMMESTFVSIAVSRIRNVGRDVLKAAIRVLREEGILEFRKLPDSLHRQPRGRLNQNFMAKIGSLG